MSKFTRNNTINKWFRIDYAKPGRTKALLFALAVFTISGVNAQEDTTGKKLEEVVVTGQYKPQSLKNSVYNVKVIPQERIRLRNANNVQQILSTELGFRLVNDNTLGTTDVQMMGMSGRSVKILLDGIPIVDRNDVRESLGQIDVNTIEKIEIVEGPMSVSYGTDALAGVINIITKKGKSDNLSVTARVMEETAADEYYPFSYQGLHQQNLGVNWQKKAWSVSAGITHIDFNGYGGDDFGRAKSWKPKEQYLGHIRLGYRTEKLNVYYRIDGLDETITSRGAISQAYTVFDQRYFSKRLMHQLQGEWFANDRLQVNSILSYTDYNRRTRSTKSDFIAGTTVLTTEDGHQDTAKFNTGVFRTTVQYKLSDKVSLQPGIDINRDEASGQRILGNPVIMDYAFFVSSEIKPTAAINIRPGLRFIKNSKYDAPPVIPSINGRWAITDDLNLRVGYAYGFRSPALRELYFNFIDANHSIIGNPNLKAETSNSVNASLNWSAVKKRDFTYTAVLGGFYNKFKNLIDYGFDANNPTVTTLINVTEHKTTGVTLENTFTYQHLRATLGASYIGRYNLYSDDPAYKQENMPSFVWTPEVNSNITYTWEKINTQFALFYKFTGKRPAYQLATVNGQTNAVLTEIGAFHLADFTVSKNLFKLFTLGAGVKNIFDVTSLTNTSIDSGGAHSTGGPVPMSYGRSYFVSLAFQWNKK